MKYSFKCPACNHVVDIDAETDEEAIEKITGEGMTHSEEAHPELETTKEEMEELVRSGMERTAS